MAQAPAIAWQPHPFGVVVLCLCCATSVAAEWMRFRVWAPNARWVSIHATVGRWPPSNLTRASSTRDLEGEYWEGDIADVALGDCYVFCINGGPGRIDPRAVDISADGSCSVVPSPYMWRSKRRVIVPRNRAVLYELHVASFTSAGTFDAAIDRLDYLKDLGVNVLELMPVTYNNADNNWGYSPMAPYAVEPKLGGSLGLRRFVDEAALRGFAVALDIVWNHASFNSLLHEYDGPEDIYFYKGDMRDTAFGPRPSYAKGGSAQYILDSLVGWVDDFRIGGFRWDTTSCIRLTGPNCDGPVNPEGYILLQRANELVHSGIRAGTLSYAEDNSGWVGVTQPVTDGVSWVPFVLGGEGFDGQWTEFGARWYRTIIRELPKLNTTSVDLDLLSDTCAAGKLPDRVLYAESHDSASNQRPQGGRVPQIVARALSSVPNGTCTQYLLQKKSILLIAMVLLCSGTPMLFQGQEFMASQSFDYPRAHSLDWHLVEANIGFHGATRDLIALRTNTLNLTHGLLGEGGKRLMLDKDSEVAVLQRGTGVGSTVVIINVGEAHHAAFQLQGIPYDGLWEVLFNGDRSVYSPLFRDKCLAQNVVSVVLGRAELCVPAMSVVVLGVSPISLVLNVPTDRREPSDLASIFYSVALVLFNMLGACIAVLCWTGACQRRRHAALTDRGESLAPLIGNIVVAT
eukprot:TRINITY_DN18497_c0_g2_i1.p1 TRINITY_DN18497_c0_g2~~TRINITY_DN18497_c0_g2_i1.p1  ORF type:complete len:685 (+),score=77.11 TRINITY_DN18497_c0_g2_i1:90-2144(+)